MKDSPASSIRQAISEHLADLSPTEKRVAEYTIRHYRDCGMLGLQELAKECGTSNATVTRYSRSLGFAGYQDYLDVLRRELTSKTSLDQFQETVRSGSPADLLALSLAEDASQLQHLNDSLDPAAFATVVESLVSARRVFLIGQGSSQFLSGYLAFNLQGTGLDTTQLGADSGIEGIARKCLQMTSEDVLIAIAFPRYSRLTVEVAQAAARTNSRVFTISNSLSGPLAEASDLILCAPNRRELHSGSGISAMAVCEALITAVATTFTHAEKAAEQLSPLIDQHLVT